MRKVSVFIAASGLVIFAAGPGYTMTNDEQLSVVKQIILQLPNTAERFAAAKGDRIRLYPLVPSTGSGPSGPKNPSLPPKKKKH